MAKKQKNAEANIAEETKSKSEKDLDALFDTSDVDPTEYGGEPEGETIISGASFWDWEKNDVFIGQYKGVVADNSAEAEEGDILGYEFDDVKGQSHLIGSNFAITKALESPNHAGVKIKDMNPNAWLWIRFLRKIQAKKGEFNSYKIKLIKDPRKKG